MPGRYRTFDVPVAGGSLRVGAWGNEGPLVLCSHGITANHVSFEVLAETLGAGVRLVAPDHRGRGRSRDVEPPFGMQAHAADLIAILDHLGEERADVLVGHSMGGFVAAVTKAAYGSRIGPAILVDGGLPLMDEIPQGLSVEALIRGIIGPAMERLEMTFASIDAYRDFWRQHPALRSAWSSWFEHYADYDLVGTAPELRPSTKPEAVLGDTRSQLIEDTVPRALAALRGPVRFLRAPRGILDGDPLYSEERLTIWAGKIDGFSWTTIPDTNHYTILIGESGSRAIADEIHRLL